VIGDGGFFTSGQPAQLSGKAGGDWHGEKLANRRIQASRKLKGRRLIGDELIANPTYSIEVTNRKSKSKGGAFEGVWPCFVSFKELAEVVGLVVCKVYWSAGSLEVLPTEN